MDNRNKILIVTFLAMFTFGMVMQSIPPVLATLIKEMQLSHAQAGSLMSLYALPGIIFSIPGGALADYYGPRRVGMVSLLLLLAGTVIVATGSTFSVLAAGRIIAGIGGTTIVIVSAQALSRGFFNNKLGTAMGIFNAGVPAGTVFAHNVFNRALVAWGWRVPLFFTALVCLGMLIVFWRFSGFPKTDNEKNMGKEDSKKLHGLSLLGGLKNIRGHLSIWLVAIAWMAFMVARISSLTFAPDYFLSIGYNITYAGFLASLFTMASLVISPGIGRLLDKTGKAENYLIFGGVILAGLYFSVGTALTGHLFLAISIGVVAAIMPVSIFSLVPKLLPQEKLGLGYGILRICENTGILMGPFLVGLSYDLSSTYFHGFLIMSIFSLAAASSGLLLKLHLHKKNNLQAD